MDSPLIEKIKQIILSTNPADWQKEEDSYSEQSEIRLDNLWLSYWRQFGDRTFYIEVEGKALELSKYAQKNLIWFCEALFYGRENYLEGSAQKKLADKIMNYKIEATS